MKIACIALLAAGAFAVQDTTPPVISLNLMGMSQHLANSEHNRLATEAHGKSFTITNKNSAGTECIRTSSVAACPLPQCEVHDHHDQTISCKAPTITRVRDQPPTVDATTYPLDDDLNRARLGQYLLEYNAEDASGNKADTVTFSFLFIDPFQPSFAGFDQAESDYGFTRFQIPGYPKDYFEGNVNTNAAKFAAYTGVKKYGRVCNKDNSHDKSAECRGNAKACTIANFGSKAGGPWACTAGGVVNTDVNGDALTSFALTAGEHSFFKYGSSAGTSTRTGRTSWAYNFGATVTDKNHVGDMESKPYYTADTLQVYVRVNGGAWTTTGENLDTRARGYQTIDYYVEDGAAAYGYKQVNNPQFHRVELEFYDQIKPKIYLKCYTNPTTYTQHVAGDGRHRANDAAAPSPDAATGAACVSTVSDGASGVVDLCVGDACKYTPPASTGVTLECDRDQSATDVNDDLYVDPGMWVLDNVDSWKSADTLVAEDCAVAGEVGCLNGRLKISPDAATQAAWTNKVQVKTVTYKAEDTTGNKADDVTRTVTVVDRFAPTLTLVGDTVVQNSAGAAVNNDQSDATQNSKSYWEGSNGLFDHQYHKADANGQGGYTCTDSCNKHSDLDITISLYQGAACNADGTVKDAQDKTRTQIGSNNDWTFPEYVTGSYAIHYVCKDKSDNWAEACREVLNVDHTRPIIQILGSNDMTLEATHQGNYIDDGATCSDQVDGVISQNVEVSGDVVNLSKVGLYKIQYNCKDNADRAANVANRNVRVEQTSCPTCKVTDCDAATGCSMFHEASFAYTDSGATCSDVIDGDITAECVTCDSTKANCGRGDNSDAVKQASCDAPTRLINSQLIGTYYITYVAQNTVNKWNYDADCRGQPTEYVRTVVVQDTLKPVITLKYGANDAVVAQGSVSTKSLSGYGTETGVDQSAESHTAVNAATAEGPGDNYRGATNNPQAGTNSKGEKYPDFTPLMAEETSSGVNGWVLGAIASAVTGLALLGYSQRKTTVATSVPV